MCVLLAPPLACFLVLAVCPPCSLLCVPQGDPRYEKVSPSLVEPKKGKKRPRFLDQFAGYEAAIREKAFLNGYTIIKVLATQTNMPKAMLKEQYMKDIEVLHREGDKFDFTGNYLIVTADSLTLPTPS